MTVPTAPTLQPCILRILNGPLQGCEFPLGEGTTLFVVGAVEVLGDGARVASVPADTIFIPLEVGGCNFEVLADQATPDGVPLRLLGDSVEVRHCVFQARVQLGGLQVTLRSADQPWAPECLGPADSPCNAAAFSGWRAHWTRCIAGALALVMLVTVVSLWSMPGPPPETDIRALIAGASAPVQVLRGRDEAVYVFVSSERDAGWSRQVLTRHARVNSEVLLLNQERRRLEQLLVDHDPQLAWHFLDLKDPSVPRLLLSAQRNLLTPDKEAKLLDTLLAAAPYARDVVVQRQDDALLAAVAQAGLQRLALTFSRLEHEDAVAFAIEGNLQDVELAAARQYVERFYRQWGDRYVHFTVELKDDALKGKSFQTGPQGYVKTSPSSWHFSNKQSR
ncbi:PrgH/EprH family type III secretion apparatus protein [Pseudomonas ogarae]|uniref:PrgH/EprH family type III secretion apparatus protein n=1 Tax=Pseudomonas ogarae (strain DSM 112162 / CECT 30235 / F113) TaxID=1114970 RepID=UPI001645AC8A|nr:PrgH/EprH family type III secretion apparatus protein [Pseudomonas zarinae]QXH96736.1 PrgH/EprH family type III secretion apparatus protein [Pseudomonas zarinae]